MSWQCCHLKRAVTLVVLGKVGNPPAYTARQWLFCRSGIERRSTTQVLRIFGFRANDLRRQRGRLRLLRSDSTSHVDNSVRVLARGEICTKNATHWNLGALCWVRRDCMRPASPERSAWSRSMKRETASNERDALSAQNVHGIVWARAPRVVRRDWTWIGTHTTQAESSLRVHSLVPPTCWGLPH